VAQFTAEGGYYYKFLADPSRTFFFYLAGSAPAGGQIWWLCVFPINGMTVCSVNWQKVITFICIFNLLKVMTLCYNIDDRFRRKEVVLWQKRRQLPM